MPPGSLPSTIGYEAAGVVEAVGAGVSNVAVGDKVTYTGFLNTLGAYSTERLVDAAPLIKLPDAISLETAAAMTMRGLTSAYLMRRIYDFKPGETILLHAAAGGVGLIVSQWAKLLGLNVIGTVSTEEKAAVARAHGCDHTINYSHEDIAKRVRELTGGLGVDVVIDSVGKNTFIASLDSLRRRGLMVCVGTASGTIAPFDPQLLARKGSLFLTRPALADYGESKAQMHTETLAFARALGDRRGITRYGDALIPMDETLTRVALDISGRPYLVWKSAFTQPKLGDLDTEMVKEFFAAFAGSAGITLHIETLYGVGYRFKE